MLVGSLSQAGQKLLEDQGYVVIHEEVGNPGNGKTSRAWITGNEYENNGFSVFIEESINSPKVRVWVKK